MCALSALRSLPYYASPLVGREAELELLRDLIADPQIHLITVTGTAGIGKTRLSVHLATEHCDREVLFVSLAAISDSGLVAAEIAKALEVQGNDLLQLIRARLEEWQGLILLDNFEQVIAGAPEIASIIPPNPNLTVIITSQRPLQIEGEHVVRLDPLSTPAPDIDESELFSSPSVQVLIHRATEQDSSFPDSLQVSSTSEAIGEICRKLEGIPLAIELAASRLSSLSPEVVLAQLERDQSILSSRRLDTPERQRTMHSAISWSFCLLPEETRRIFLWLGSFTAGFDLDVVERLIGHLQVPTRAVDVITEFMGVSLIRRTSGGANPWYSMLVSIQQFTLAELDASGERAAAEAFVIDYVRDLASQSSENLIGPQAALWSAALNRELPTIRSSVGWALATGNARSVLEVASNIAPYMEQIGQRVEVGQWLDHALTMRKQLPELVVLDGLLTRLKLHESAREFRAAEAIGAEIETLLKGKNYPTQHVRFLHNMGNVAQMQLQRDKAEVLFERTVELASKHGLVREAAIAHGMLGMVWLSRGNYVKAETHYLELREVMAELGDTHTEVRVLINLSATANSQGDAGRSLSYLDEALSKIRTLDHKRELIYILLNQSATLTNLGEFEAAIDAAKEAIEVAHEYQYPTAVAGGYHELCQIHLLQGELSRAAAMAIRSLDALPEDEDEVQIQGGLGVLIAETLAKAHLFADSTALLAKARQFTANGQYHFEVEVQKRIDQLESFLPEHVQDYETNRERGLSWSDEEYLRNIYLLSRRLASRGSSIIVRIPVPDHDAFPELTSREREILDLLIAGQSTRDMADTLSVSPRTVTTHIGNIMAKMDVNSRAELVAKALHRQQSFSS